MEWWFDDGGASGHNATLARVYLRDLGGNQIGTAIWEPAIPNGQYGGPDSGVVESIIHLDDNPMDGVIGGATPRVFARGVLSNNGLRLYDNWKFGAGAVWNAAKWATSSNSSGRLVDIQGNRGRIQTGASTSSSSTARATAQMADLADAEVNLTHEFCASNSSPCISDRNAGSDLRIHLRGTGASSSTSGVDNAYRLDIESDSTTVKLKRLVNGAATTIGSFSYNPDGLSGPDPGRHRIRFRVQGSTIQTAVWPDGTSDESWDITVTDTAVTAPGKLQITHYRASTGTGRSVHVDDLWLYATGGQVFAQRLINCAVETAGTKLIDGGRRAESAIGGVSCSEPVFAEWSLGFEVRTASATQSIGCGRGEREPPTGYSLNPMTVRKCATNMGTGRNETSHYLTVEAARDGSRAFLVKKEPSFYIDCPEGSGPCTLTPG